MSAIRWSHGVPPPLAEPGLSGLLVRIVVGVGSIRVVWMLYLTLFVLAAVVVLAMLLLDGALWLVPILIVFGFCTYILFRNRSRRAHFR